MTYSEIEDIQSRLPFELNENSLPKWEYVKGHGKYYGHGVIDQANSIINAYLGRTSDYSGNTAGLKTVEIDLVVAYVMAWHLGYPPRFELTELHKIILDNYKTDQLVYLGKLGFARD